MRKYDNTHNRKYLEYDLNCNMRDSSIERMYEVWLGGCRVHPLLTSSRSGLKLIECHTAIPAYWNHLIASMAGVQSIRQQLIASYTVSD